MIRVGQILKIPGSNGMAGGKIGEILQAPGGSRRRRKQTPS